MMRTLLDYYSPIDSLLSAYGCSVIEQVADSVLILKSYRSGSWYLETCFSQGGGAINLDLSVKHSAGEATLCYTNPCAKKLTTQITNETVPGLLIDCMLDALGDNQIH